MKLLTFFSVIIFSLSQSVFSADVPRGGLQTADTLAPNTYELILIPQYVLARGDETDAFESDYLPGGMYMTAELRYQPAEEIGVGFGFGTGELGWHIGASGTWYVLPDVEGQPAFAVRSDLYLNRVAEQNFFVIRVAPTVSESIPMTWGTVTPYASLQLSPTFGLESVAISPTETTSNSDVALRTLLGTQWVFPEMGGLRLWFEVGVNVVNSMHGVSLGISYPFDALG